MVELSNNVAAERDASGHVVSADNPVEHLMSGRQQRRGGQATEPDIRLRRRPFCVLGEVVHPGTYPYEPELSVMAAVQVAGGFTHRARRNRAHIRRAGSDEEIAVPLEPDILVSPGDIIRIDGRAT